jgi:hypothetical protein
VKVKKQTSPIKKHVKVLLILSFVESAMQDFAVFLFTSQCFYCAELSCHLSP